jgi:hypothetical protein
MPDAVGRALRIFSILVAVAALLAGLHGLRERAWLFRGAPLQAFSPAFRDEVSAVEARVPPGEVVLYLGTSANDWSYILWSRALYPRNDVVRILPPAPAGRIAELKGRYRIRFAIANRDAADPGYLWSVALGATSNTSEARLGELVP